MNAGHTASMPPPTWSAGKILGWALFLLAVLAWQGRGLVRDLKPTTDHLNDFFQDWASVRFYRDGKPVYGPQAEAVKDYLGWEVKNRHPRDPFNEVNAHPPTAILVALPFGWLDYPTACLIWNLVWLASLCGTIFILVRQLPDKPSPWIVLPCVAFGLFCAPLRSQIAYGQFNLLLLLLLTSTWAAARSGKPWLAGACLGAATAIKLFPAFLFLYFLMRRDYRTILAGGVSFGILTLLTIGILGIEAYHDYVQIVLPQSARFYDRLSNSSFTGFYYRLFDPLNGNAQPLVHDPLLARLLTGISALIVVGLVAWFTYRARTQAMQDHAYGLALIGMLLVSPLNWPHYALLLVLPGVLIWRDLPWLMPRALLNLALAVLWFPELTYWGPFFHVTPKTLWLFTPTPAQSVLIISWYFYAFGTLFLLNCFVFRLLSAESVSSQTPPVPPRAP